MTIESSFNCENIYYICIYTRVDIVDDDDDDDDDNGDDDGEKPMSMTMDRSARAKKRLLATKSHKDERSQCGFIHYYFASL